MQTEVIPTLPVPATVIQNLNDAVAPLSSMSSLSGFDKTFTIALATARLNELLTPEYMRYIMELQGLKSGFKTDRDNDGGYPEKVVKRCVIDAIVTGLQVTGNQFNIIDGGFYVTKEGFGYLLDTYPGLFYEIKPSSYPRVTDDRATAAVIMQIEWTINGQSYVKHVDFPVGLKKSAASDLIIGKATRKARHWLFCKLTGVEVGEGDINDVTAKVISSKLDNPTPEELAALVDQKFKMLSPDELKFAMRIIDGKEVNSYKKLLNLLNSK